MSTFRVSGKLALSGKYLSKNPSIPLLKGITWTAISACIAFVLGCALFVPSVAAQISLPAANHIDTIAGNGYPGFEGDGGPATDAELANPTALAIDQSGNVYLADAANNVIRKITASTGVITTVAGNGTQGFAGDGGPATSAELNTPWGVAVDSSGNLYIGDTNNSVIRKVDASTHVITTIAGTNGQYFCSGDGGPATAATVKAIWGLALDSAGNLYFSDFDCNVVRKISASTGYISTVAGNGIAGSSGNGGGGNEC